MMKLACSLASYLTDSSWMTMALDAHESLRLARSTELFRAWLKELGGLLEVRSASTLRISCLTFAPKSEAIMTLACSMVLIASMRLFAF